MDRKIVSELIETLNEYEKFLEIQSLCTYEDLGISLSYKIYSKRTGEWSKIELNISNNIISNIIENIRIQANIIKDKLNQLGIQ